MPGFISLLVFLLYLYTWLIIARAVVSWIRPDSRQPPIRTLVTLTEPVLRPLRAIVPPARLGGIDVSPILAIVLIQIVRQLLVATLH